MAIFKLWLRFAIWLSNFDLRKNAQKKLASGGALYGTQKIGQNTIYKEFITYYSCILASS